LQAKNQECPHHMREHLCLVEGDQEIGQVQNKSHKNRII